jgi:hypothetical protein
MAMPMTYGDLFKYLDKKCDFRTKDGSDYDPEKPNNVTWTCDNKLTFVEEFCKEHRLDFALVAHRLQESGGWCDCEVLFNSVHTIDKKKSLERLD